jgi:outer membrane protein TolC
MFLRSLDGFLSRFRHVHSLFVPYRLDRMRHWSLLRLFRTGLLCAAIMLAPRFSAHAQSAPAASSDTLRLELTSALQRALEVSPEVDQVRAQRRYASSRYREARASRFLTSFTLSTAHSFAPGLTNTETTERPPSQYYLDPEIDNDWTPGALRPFSDFSIVARQPIWTWGELSGNIRAADHAVDVEAAQVNEKALEVAFRTGEIYYNVLLTAALDRLAARTGETIDQAKQEVQRLLDEGSEDVDDADLFQVRLTEQEYQRRLVEINQRQATARSALRRQLFLEDAAIMELGDELAPIDFALHPDSLSHYLALGLRNRPELDQAEAGIAAREALVDVERSDYYPKFAFQATYGYSFTLPERPRQDNAFIGDSYRGNRTRTGFGLQMNLNFMQTKARVEQAQAQLNEVRYQEEAAQQLIRFETEAAYRQVIIAQTDVNSRDEDVQITGEWLRTEQINFDLGFGNTENLVDAVRANLEAEARYYEAVQRFNVAVLRLWRVTGVLVNRAQSGTLIE